MEIERKFLVRGDYKPYVKNSIRIIQAYLSSVPERTVQVRMMGDQGFLTIKGVGSKSGLSRFEWEIEIKKEDVENLLEICEPGIIEKTRQIIPVQNHLFEVDEFHGDNEGLIVAEIELTAEDEPFEKPDWLGDEVTGNLKYYNAMLKQNPYKNW